jgi:2-polyprenyl-6-hydroxyphenyl methylase/3-demethylubiquinone-9 3-methyltransferase
MPGTGVPTLPSAVCAPTVSCKCCGGLSRIFAVTDFNKSCSAAARPQRLPYSGIPVYYHRCDACRFIFTTAFDHFSREDFLEHIYNPGYADVDGDYLVVRPRRNAHVIAEVFRAHRSISILDYGGGAGRLETELRREGFADVATYDPFTPGFSQRPDRKFNCVLCYEVVEHANNPTDLFTDMASLMADDGLLLFSTLLQPPEVADLGSNWWYLAPRNGHVSLYTRHALEAITRPLGLTLVTSGDDFHIAFRQIPTFARHVLKETPAPPNPPQQPLPHSMQTI